MEIIQDGNRIRRKGKCSWCTTFDEDLKPADRHPGLQEFLCIKCHIGMNSEKTPNPNIQ
jgi:hypothetical protein